MNTKELKNLEVSEKVDHLKHYLRNVNAAIEKGLKDYPYGEDLNETFRRAEGSLYGFYRHIPFIKTNEGFNWHVKREINALLELNIGQYTDKNWKYEESINAILKYIND